MHKHPNPLTIKRLDHLGIVAGIIDEIGLVEKIDDLIPPAPQRIVSCGNAVKAMILNALGFVSRPLYLHPQFFSGKPVEHLFRDDKTTRVTGVSKADPSGPKGNHSFSEDGVLHAEHFNESSLGRALDDLHAAGTTSLYYHVASRAMERGAQMNRSFRRSLGRDLQESLRLLRLDSTSFSLHGDYPDSVERQKRAREREEAIKKARKDGDEEALERLEEEAEQDDEPFVITITHGFSKDHRDDLKQFVLNLVTAGQSRIPLWVEPLSGNAADKKTFRETINSFLESVQESEEPYCFVMDSAFYTTTNLTELSSRIHWLTRAPETVGFVGRLIEEVGPRLHAGDPEEGLLTDPDLPGYRWIELGTVFAGVPQRILVVYSEKSFLQEKKTLEKRIDKERQALTSALDALSSRPFSCQEDARKSLQDLFKTAKYHTAGEITVTEVRGYASKGRPKKGSEPPLLGVTISAPLLEDPKKIATALSKKGLFVLATNNVDDASLSSRSLLSTYKAQGSTIEGSHRFLKDPRVYAESFFLKKESRIMALITILAMALLVYALAEERLREALAALKQGLPDQLGRMTNRPTLRWIFQLLENIHWQPHKRDPAGMIALTDDQLRVISFFPPKVRRYYGAPEAT